MTDKFKINLEYKGVIKAVILKVPRDMERNEESLHNLLWQIRRWFSEATLELLEWKTPVESDLQPDPDSDEMSTLPDSWTESDSGQNDPGSEALSTTTGGGGGSKDNSQNAGQEYTARNIEG